MNRKVIYGFTILIAATIIVRIVILGGSPAVSLGPAPALSGTISQSLLTSTTNHSRDFIPLVNKDYSIKSVKYIDDWAVVTLDLKNSGSSATFVMHKVNGFYEGVLGPGTAFSVSSTISLPADVISYMKTSGVLIYMPSGGE